MSSIKTLCTKTSNMEIIACYAICSTVIPIFNSTYTLRLRWAVHVARMEQGRSAIKILPGKPSEKRPLEVLGVTGRRVLEWILRK